MLIADAAQNGMAGEDKSLTEGGVIVATIFAWNYRRDWLVDELYRGGDIGKCACQFSSL